MKISEKDIGRRVVVNGEYDDEIFKNEPGVFKCFGINTYYPGIVFDEPRRNFHTLDNRCKNKYGFYVPESMITFTDEENKMDKDFQVGDEVETVRYLCKGVIIEIRTVEYDYPIQVKWSNTDTDSYTISGKGLTPDDCPILYHAGSIKREGGKIIIDPVEPVREKWYNVYLNEAGPFFGSGYKSKDEAIKEIIDNMDYITTIQLKRSIKQNEN